MLSRKKDRKRNFRIFFRTAFICCFLFILGAGFIIADYNTRRVGFGNGSMRLEVAANQDGVYINMFGRESTFIVPKEAGKWIGRVWNVLPPSVRAAFWLFEGECDAAAEIIRRTSP